MRDYQIEKGKKIRPITKLGPRARYLPDNMLKSGTNFYNKMYHNSKFIVVSSISDFLLLTIIRGILVSGDIEYINRDVL